jgi:hypothetical protein
LVLYKGQEGEETTTAVMKEGGSLMPESSLSCSPQEKNTRQQTRQQPHSKLEILKAWGLFDSTKEQWSPT